MFERHRSVLVVFCLETVALCSLMIIDDLKLPESRVLELCSLDCQN